MIKKIVDSKPKISFVFLTYFITYICWFSPYFFEVPKDFTACLLLLGMSAPFISGFLIVLIRSSVRPIIYDRRIFIITFLILSFVIVCRFAFADHEYFESGLNFIPKISEIGIFAWVFLFSILILISFTISNCRNGQLKGNYLQSFSFSKSKIKWYVIGFLLIPLIFTGSHWSGLWLGLKSEQASINFHPLFILNYFFAFCFLGGNEEFGWRGFLQTEMQKSYSPLVSLILISLLSSFWHLPLYFNGVFSHEGIAAFPRQIIVTIPVLIIITWLYNKSKYSLLAVMLFHAMLNSAGAFSATIEILLGLILILCIFLIVNGRMWKKQELKYEK